MANQFPVGGHLDAFRAIQSNFSYNVPAAISHIPYCRIGHTTEQTAACSCDLDAIHLAPDSHCRRQGERHLQHTEGRLQNDRGR